MTTSGDPPTPTSARRYMCSAMCIGAAASVCIAVLIGLFLANDMNSSIGQLVTSFLILPAIIGGVLGAGLGWSIGVIRRSDARVLNSLVAWVLVCVVAPVLLPALIRLFYGWATGIGSCGFPLRSTGASVAPFSITALANAMSHVVVEVAIFGIPVGAVGAVIGVIVALVRWGRRYFRAQNVTNEPEKKDHP